MPELGDVETPGRPLQMPDCPWEIRRPAPLLGQHNDEVLAEAVQAKRPARNRDESQPVRLPLEGLRVIDLCVVWAGPFSTLLLGDLGAEVIKVENPFLMQPMTRGSIARPTKELLNRLAPAAGGYPNGEPGPRAWNYNPTFVSLYRNKKSVTMDLRTEEGRDLFGRLVATADVVIENNATETMEKLGITYEWLKARKPDIIMMRIPAYGSAGDYAQARALGVHLESVMGHTLLRGYADLDPSNNTAIFSGDYLAGTQTALAAMMAVRHRDRTGRGQKIELAQAENASAMMAQAFMDYSLNGRVQERRGNRSLYNFAPWGVYPTIGGSAEDAEDRWIAISVSSDDEWRALVHEMGDPDWADDPQLATNAGRLACHDEIDERIALWTAGFEDYDLFHRLQAAGVTCAPVIEGSRAHDDPQVLARGTYQPQTLPDGLGPYRFTTPMFHFPGTPITVRNPPVAMGQHNDYVYREVIGVTEEEYDHYKELGYVSMDFVDSIP
jgi:crotonobetainyl-CoA:carnitine CoA-transferase CaiB-like acyl-CoA transferase